MKWHEQVVDVDGLQLPVRIGEHPQGRDKPVLVLLHEALGSFGQWKHFPERLAEACGQSVMLYERQGHGGASPLTLPRGDDYLIHEGCQVLPQLLARLDLQRVVLVGHSDGGSITLLSAAQLPRQVVGLVTIAAHLFVEEVTLAGIREAVAVYAEKLRAPLARYHGEQVDTLFRAWHETWLRDSFQTLDLSCWLGAIECPTLVVQGLSDQYGTEAQVSAICAGIGRAAEPCWLQAGHVPHLEDEASLVAAISGFVGRHAGLSQPATATA